MVKQPEKMAYEEVIREVLLVEMKPKLVSLFVGKMDMEFLKAIETTDDFIGELRGGK